jgi:hypothetical protein
MGSFLRSSQEVRGNARCITFHDEKTQEPLLSAYPQNPMDTIFWIIPQKIDTASVATIYTVDYDVWHKRLGGYALRRMSTSGGNLRLTLQYTCTTILQFVALSGVPHTNWFMAKFLALGIYVFLGVEPMYTSQLMPERISSLLEVS